VGAAVVVDAERIAVVPGTICDSTCRTHISRRCSVSVHPPEPGVQLAGERIKELTDEIRSRLTVA
jgi:hypothetical protein